MTTTSDNSFPEALYFGCGNDGRSGHGFWQSDSWSFSSYDAFDHLPWGKSIDGELCPHANLHKEVPRDLQIEGPARRHHQAGWTAIAFWDRSADTRHGSNSVFVIRGDHSFDRMVELARYYFPRTWARFPFEVVEAVQRVNDKVV